MASRFDKPTYCADPNCDRGCNEAQMIYQCALRISQAADTIGRLAHPVSKPKGKKKTFFRSKPSNGRDVYPADGFSEDDACIWDAWKYCEENPGSILEIVVRKPVK